MNTYKNWMIACSNDIQVFQEWRQQLDKLCKKVYLIDTDDMGFDTDQLMKLWMESSTPEEVSDYFGLKYDLTRAEDVMLRG